MQSEPLASALFGRWFDLSADAMFVVDRGTAAIVCANRRFAEVLDAPCEELLGAPLRPWMVDAEEVEILLAKEPVYRDHVGFRSQRGQVVHLSLSLCQTTWEGRALVACVGKDTTTFRAAERERVARASAMHAAHGDLTRLVSELHHAKLELEDRNREIAVLAGQVSRFGWRAAVGELVAGIAHHLNNPVGALTSTLRRLEQKLADVTDVEQRKALEGPLRRCREIARRIEANVDAVVRTHVVGSSEPNRRWLVLQDEIETALAMFADRLRHVVIIRDYEDHPLVLAPHDSLHLVLANLVDNSLRAIAQHGALTFTIRRRGDLVVLRVSDNGGGIPAQVAPHLFEPILSAREGGAGLGLSTAQRLARAWGGSIAHVPVSVGAAFEITIPTKEAARAAPRESDAPRGANDAPLSRAAPVGAAEQQEKHA